MEATTEDKPERRVDLDAMGNDKRRPVVGHSYGPSKGRQLALYGAVVALLIVLYIGASYAVSELDKAPASNPDKAPWSRADAPQIPPEQFQ